jgi:hypothetical protein
MSKPTHEPITLVIEWQLLLNPLIVLIVIVMLGAALVVISLQYQQYIKDWKFEQGKIFGDLEAKYSRLQEAIEVVNNMYLQKFSQLEEEGFFVNDPNLNVEDQRLNMYQAIKQLLSRIPLVGGAGYQLLEKKIYRPSRLDIDNEVKTYETEIILKLNLLHEEDVLQLVEVVEFQQFTGLFNFTHCQIKRLREEISLKDISKANFEAECVLAWYTSKIEPEE